MEQRASAAEWPFFGDTPPDRIELQRQLIAGDPFFRLLGIRLEEVTLSVAFRAELAQPSGILHGGVHGILIDSAIAQALLTTIRPGFSIVTVHLDVKYFAAVSDGQLLAQASVIRKGKRIAHGEAVVRDETGTRVAQGWGVFAITGGPAPRSERGAG